MHIQTKNVKLKTTTRDVPVVSFNLADDSELLKSLVKQARDIKDQLLINPTLEQQKYTTYSVFANLLAKTAWAAFFKQRVGVDTCDVFEEHTSNFLLDTTAFKTHASHVRNGINFAFNDKYGFDVLGPSKLELDSGDTKDIYLQAIIEGDLNEWGDSLKDATRNNPIQVYLAGVATIEELLGSAVPFKKLQDLTSGTSNEYKIIPLHKSITPATLINILYPTLDNQMSPS